MTATCPLPPCRTLQKGRKQSTWQSSLASSRTHSQQPSPSFPQARSASALVPHPQCIMIFTG